ncbi:MAG: ABC transporter ATP-binding protein [Pseudomonadota bacterium]
MRDMPPLLAEGRSALLAKLVAIGVCHTAAVVATALCLRHIINTLGDTGAGVSGAAASSTLGPALILIGCAVAAGALRWAERVVAERLGQGYVSTLRLAVFDHLTSVSPRALSRKRQGTLITRFVTDLGTLKNWISAGIARACVGTVSTVGCLAALITLQPWIGWTVVAIVCTAIGCLLLSGTLLDTRIRAARRQRGRLAGNVAEKLHSMATVQAFHTHRRERARLAKQSRALLRAMAHNAWCSGGIRAGAQLAGGLCSAATVLIGAWAASRGQATAGDVVAALSIVAMLSTQFYPFGRLYQLWRAARVASERTRALLRLPRLKKRHAPTAAPDAWQGELRFDTVSVAGSLTPFSAAAAPGQRIAIQGRNGSGKSTLLQLANRLIDPDAGQITLDGAPIASLPLATLRRRVALVSTALPLLRGTVRSNLSYGLPRCKTSALKRVARRCGMDITSPDSPFFLDRLVAENGHNLSQGERMRLLLARALIRQPTVLLLDEADAALDAAGLRALKRVIARYPGTVLFVTHRRTLAATADVCWQLDRDASAEPVPDPVAVPPIRLVT